MDMLAVFISKYLVLCKSNSFVIFTLSSIICIFNFSKDFKRSSVARAVILMRLISAACASASLRTRCFVLASMVDKRARNAGM